MARKSKVFLMCILFCVFSSAAMANNTNPNLNWGATDFTDPPPQMPGFTFIMPTIFYSGKFKDGDGDSLPGDNKLSLIATVPQLVWTAACKLPGDISWGLTVGQILASLNVDSNLGSVVPFAHDLTATNGVLGDTFAGVFIGRSHQLAKDWTLHWMAEFDTYMPTGTYHRDKDINLSANYWSFEPFLALRLQMPYGFEVSARQHYTWNTKNRDYRNMMYGPGEHDLKAGDLYRVLFSASKSLDFISPLLRFGAVGYYGKQLDNDEIDGNSIPNSKEKVFAIGPGVQYTWIPKGARAPAAIFSLKTYWESGVKNRTEGNKTVFRMAIPF